MRRTQNLLNLMTSSIPRDDHRFDTQLTRMEFVADGLVRHQTSEEGEYATSVTGEAFKSGDLVWVMRRGPSQYIIGSARST